MIGSRPVYRLAPLEYRLALDAAASLLSTQGPPVLSCGCQPLAEEVRQRFPAAPAARPARAALWVEPGLQGWRAELTAIVADLAPGGTLVVIASRPLARLLRERHSWGEAALGQQLGGLGRLGQELRAEGLVLRAERDFHGPTSMILSSLSSLAERAGLPALGDRLLAAARRSYRERAPLAALATVALLVAEKGPRR